jgi:hypothetical protein
MVKNTKSHMRMSIRAMLIAMGVMTGVAAAPKSQTPANAKVAAAAPKSQTPAKATGVAVMAPEDKSKAQTGISSMFSQVTASAKAAVSKVQDAATQGFNKAVNMSKAGQIGQNTIDIIDMVRALENLNDEAHQHIGCVNGAVPLVLYALEDLLSSPNVRGELKKAISKIKKTLIEKLNELCIYEVSGSVNKAGRNEQSTANEWTGRVLSLCLWIGSIDERIKNASESDNTKENASKSDNTKENASELDDTKENASESDNTEDKSQESIKLQTLKSTLENLVKVLTKVQTKVGSMLTSYTVCFQQCSENTIDISMLGRIESLASPYLQYRKKCPEFIQSVINEDTCHLS